MSRTGDISTANLHTAQAVLEAFGQRDIDTILSHLTDDVDWASAAEGSAPWHGPHKGKEEVPQFFSELAAAVETTEFTPLAFATNDTDVVVVIRYGIRATATGRAGEVELHRWWQFRDGKVCRYRGTEDTALTAPLLAWLCCSPGACISSPAQRSRCSS